MSAAEATDEHTQNLHRIVASDLNHLWTLVSAWQRTHRKRFLSFQIVQDVQDRTYQAWFATNPTEVIIVDGYYHQNRAAVENDGRLNVNICRTL